MSVPITRPSSLSEWAVQVTTDEGRVVHPSDVRVNDESIFQGVDESEDDAIIAAV